MVRDLTAMKRSEHERRFFEFTFKLTGEADSSHEVLTAAVQTICHFTRRHGPGVAARRQRPGLQPVLVLQRLRVREAARGQRLDRLPARRGPAGLAWAKRQPLLLEDIRQPGRGRPAGRGPGGHGRARDRRRGGGGGAGAVRHPRAGRRAGPAGAHRPGRRGARPPGRAAVRLDGRRGRRQAADRDHPRAVPGPARGGHRPGPAQRRLQAGRPGGRAAGLRRDGSEIPMPSSGSGASRW
jgi:hypothetical protein